MPFLTLFALFQIALAAQDNWVTLNNAGVEALSEGRYAEARKALSAAWVRARQFDEADERRGIGAYSLATACQVQGDLGQAEMLLTEAIAVFERIGTKAHSSLAQAVDGMGDLRLEQGRFKEAEDLYTRGLALNREIHGDFDSLTALSYRHLGMIDALMAKPLESEDAFQHSLRTYRRDPQQFRTVMGIALEGLGRLYLSQRRYDEAEALMKESFEYSKALPDAHPNRADAMLNLGMVYRLKGDAARAEPLLRKALAIYDKAGDARRLSALSELAGLATDEKKYKIAERYMCEVLQTLIQRLGADHPSVATAGNWLANVYAYEGKFAQAETLVEKSLAIERKTYGGKHPEVEKSLALLAVIQKKSHLTIEVGEQTSFRRGSAVAPR